MADIRHRVGINAPVERVYQALATTDGLAGWWTREVKGVSQVGETLDFFFGSPEPGAASKDPTSGSAPPSAMTCPPTGPRPRCCSPTPSGGNPSSSCTTAARSG